MASIAPPDMANWEYFESSDDPEGGKDEGSAGAEDNTPPEFYRESDIDGSTVSPERAFTIVCTRLERKIELQKG